MHKETAMKFVQGSLILSPFITMAGILGLSATINGIRHAEPNVTDINVQMHYPSTRMHCLGKHTLQILDNDHQYQKIQVITCNEQARKP